MGSSSAVGTAVRNELRMGRPKSVLAKSIKAFRSVLEIPPIGFMSAELQSYYVEFWSQRCLFGKWPLRHYSPS